MITGRPKKPVILSEEVREQLGAIVNSRSLPHGLVRRAHIVLLAADGISNNAIAERVGISRQMVCYWRKRYLQQGLAGLHDELRPGRARSISDEEVATLVRRTIETKPRDGTHWTVRAVAKDSELSRTTVHRIWQAFGLQPHRQRHFKLSTDPFFVEKVRDIAGLYLNPPDKAMVLCVDEKSEIQALDRTQPRLAIGLGYLEGVTHDYVRNGTTTLFAALDIANGQVLILNSFQDGINPRPIC
jgi:putative transposase